MKPEENTNTLARDFNTPSTEADTLPSESSAANVTDESNLKDQTAAPANDEPIKKIDPESDNRNNDLEDKVNPLKKSQGSFFSPFSLPKKPAEPNLKAPDTNPTKNLNKDSDSK